jgi:hypothetical protein
MISRICFTFDDICFAHTFLRIGGVYGVHQLRQNVSLLLQAHVLYMVPFWTTLGEPEGCESTG